MKIAITGASGRYGMAAAYGLLEKVPARDIVLLTRTPAKLQEFSDLNCQVREGDFDDLTLMIDALSDVDRMLMISTGRVGQRLAQHKNAIDAAKAAGVKHIVYTSFIGLVPENPALVAREHTQTEELLRGSGLNWTALRDSQYIDAFIEAAGPLAIKTGVWMASTGEGRLAPVAREDCVACAVSALSGEGHENKVYNITGPERLSWPEICEIFAQVSGVPIVFKHASEDEMYALFDAMGIPRDAEDDLLVDGFGWSSEDMVSFEAAIRGGFFDIISDDVEHLTGRKPLSARALIERSAELRALSAEPAVPGS